MDKNQIYQYQRSCIIILFKYRICSFKEYIQELHDLHEEWLLEKKVFKPDSPVLVSCVSTRIYLKRCHIQKKSFDF